MRPNPTKRARNYDIPAPPLVTNKPDRHLECPGFGRQRCGWSGRADEAVPYSDELGVAVACPVCGADILASSPIFERFVGQGGSQ